MSAYTAPLKDMRFVLNELAGLAAVAKLPGYQDATPDTVDAILEEASKFATEVLDPLNYSGDQEGSRWKDGRVAGDIIAAADNKGHPSPSKVSSSPRPRDCAGKHRRPLRLWRK